MDRRPLALASLLLLLAISAPQAQTQKYQLKEDRPPLSILPPGSRESPAEGGLPFDKSYEQLTLSQQRSLKSAYVEMGDTDEPPFPIGGLRAIYRPITEAQQNLMVEGLFKAHVEIDANGDPSAIAVFSSPSKETTDVVARAVMAAKFKPALCAGKACKMGFPLQIAFKTK